MDFKYANIARFYTTVFSQCFSVDGKYLAVGDNFGKISIFAIPNCVNADGDKLITSDSKKCIYQFDAHDGPVYSLIAVNKFLISAGHGDILGWTWSSIINKAAKVGWTMIIPKGDGYDKPETNVIAVTEKNGNHSLFAGCGDGIVHIYDLETGQLKNNLCGHSDYIHCLSLASSGLECWTGGEDGRVMLWDTRKGEDRIHIIEPYKTEICARPSLGKWISCLALDEGDDWIVCGGGPSLSLWHLRSLSCTTAFETPGSNPLCTTFYEDLILSGGSESNIHHWSYNGDLRATVPMSSLSIFNLAFSDKISEKPLLAVAGSSPYIDICTNLRYRDFSLELK